MRAIVWLERWWVRGAGLLAVVLLALTPLLARTVALPVLLVFLCSPAYMLHQVEEHGGDRFRRLVNDRLFGGSDVLTSFDVLVVNVPIVWGLNGSAFWAAARWTPAGGLIAGYAMVVNAVGHLAAALRLRAYNPGAATAVGLFMPLGAAVILVAGARPATAVQHLLALGGAVLVHAGIAVHLWWKRSSGAGGRSGAPARRG